MAIGQYGLGFHDVMVMTPDELKAVCDNARLIQETRLHDDWERTRILASIIVQPYLNKTVNARELIPLPWDDDARKTEKKSERSTVERFTDLVKKLKENGK